MTVSVSPVEDIVADMAAGKIVILIDEEDRENEGDLVLAADHVTPEAINFMARFGRGLICLTLTRERCERLQLPPMALRNGDKKGTAFTVSIEAAEGVTTGISAADRSRTIEAAVAKNAQVEEARLPDLLIFAEEHGLKIGTIADLIEHRSRHESLIEKVGTRTLKTAFGEFTAHAFKDKPSQGVHMALVKGSWKPEDTVAARVHEPLSVFDALEVGRPMHSWSLDQSLQHIATAGQGVVVLLNCGESGAQLLAQFEGTAKASHAPERGRMDLRSYGIGAQILRECGVHKMNLMGNPRRMPSMTGYGLEIAGYINQR
jgi:3,4-dihydroxy 2-butanone 4-phosphate synthase/GTP cyclohydrolase II